MGPLLLQEANALHQMRATESCPMFKVSDLIFGSALLRGRDFRESARDTIHDVVDVREVALQLAVVGALRQGQTTVFLLWRGDWASPVSMHWQMHGCVLLNGCEGGFKHLGDCYDLPCTDWWLCSKSNSFEWILPGRW